MLAAIAIWMFALRGSAKPAVIAKAAGSAVDPWAAGGKPSAPRPSRDSEAGPAPRGGMPEWSLDPDREGTITLEGQVVGSDKTGIAGATVWLSSVPPRHVEADEDGSFRFDKLVGRTYSLSAKAGKLVGSLQYRVTATPDPAIIYMSEGASVAVTVVDEQAAPIAKAVVSADDLAEVSATTDARGMATLAPVEPGFVGIDVKADGYAPASTFTTVGSGGSKGTVKLTLHRGVAVAGHVVDETGAAIAQARVLLSSGTMGGFGGGGEDGDKILTNDKGEFTIPVVAPGKYTLRAMDGVHSPGKAAPITVADKPLTGVEVTMKAGGTVAGVVVDTGGAKVPYAIVRVAGAGANRWRVAPRQATADANGAFELHGLMRGKLQARAESDTAASKLVEVDLEAAESARNVKLVLDVTGVIAGIVVDGAGAPVTEVQVNAMPDFFGGGPTETMGIAGSTTATTDGAGAFKLHGLADGKYRVWASRAGASRMDFGADGVSAKTGDTAVKVTLLAPGGIKGTIVIDGATAPPKLATIAVGFQPPTPADAGVFEVKSLTPGKWDVTFRGPEFAEMAKRNVVVEAGKVTDLGTITVFRGRRLNGKVVDSKGTPVAGAKVKLGDMLFSAEGADEESGPMGDLYGMRWAVSDQDGEFTIIGVPAKGTQAAAYATSGSSPAVAVAPGKEDPPPILLTLRGFGTVVGTVTRAGQPLPSVGVSQSIKGGGAQMGFTRTDDSGAFTMTKVPEGTVVIQAMQQQMMTMRSSSTSVKVVAGQQTVAKLDFPVGNVTLTVAITPVAGQTVNFALVMLMPSGVIAPTAKEVMDQFMGGGAFGQQKWTPGASPAFTELLPGEYTVCSIPITGNMMDANFLARMGDLMFQLKAYCVPAHVAASPAAQTVTQQLPAQPLPEQPAP